MCSDKEILPEQQKERENSSNNNGVTHKALLAVTTLSHGAPHHTTLS